MSSVFIFPGPNKSNISVISGSSPHLQSILNCRLQVKDGTSELGPQGQQHPHHLPNLRATVPVTGCTALEKTPTGLTGRAKHTAGAGGTVVEALS